MKILTAEQMRRIDRLTAERAGVASLTLMENAGRQTADFLLDQFGPALGSQPGDSQRARITFLCGKGNNGGDGLVAARYLREKGYSPRLWLLAAAEDLKGDARTNHDAYLRAGGTVKTVHTVEEWAGERTSALDSDILVDALLGTGLTGPVEGLLAQVIADVNAHRSRYKVLAVDIPSGLPSDSGEPAGASVLADATITFTAPKRGQVFPPNCTRVGTLAVAPIGTPEKIYQDDPELWLNLVSARQLAPLGLVRDRTAHKGRYGHVLLIAGSKGKTGAAALGGKAALRTGPGLVTVATAASMLPVIASMVPEIMTEPLEETREGCISGPSATSTRFVQLLEGKTVLALGPGLTTHPETVTFVRQVMENVDRPLVLDADALNALAGGLEVLRRLKARPVVLTPHPGEMARLLGSTSADVQRNRVETARNFAREYGVFVILKGYRTLVAPPEGNVYVNPTGNPGMATGGVGDVLTGMVAGAMAQWPQAPLGDVLCLAVYLHGLAGDLAAERQSEQGLIASDITEALPQAWKALAEKIERDTPGSYYVIP